MELMEEIAKNPNSSGSELDVLMIAKYMERIGDHAVNLGEWVHYYVYGEKVEGKDWQLSETTGTKRKIPYMTKNR